MLIGNLRGCHASINDINWSIKVCQISCIVSDERVFPILLIRVGRQANCQFWFRIWRGCGSHVCFGNEVLVTLFATVTVMRY